MTYPFMKIDKEKVLKNARTIGEMCSSAGIDVWGVTKGLSGDPRLADIYRAAGFKGVSDSRLRNLKKIRDSGLGLPRQLMRVAMRSEIEELAEIADVSFQSEISTIIAIDELCVSKGIKREVLLMLDIGDLREGFWSTELARAGTALRNLKGGVKLSGVATNYACASGVLPSLENMQRLVGFRDTLAEAVRAELPVISVGGTCCLKIIEEKKTPPEINQLRVCEGVLLGRDTAFDREIPYLEHDAVTITAEIVECKHKPSVPVGKTGRQAFGENLIFVDRGMRKRALLGIGRQDTNVDKITPIEQDVQIITASSDHLIVDVTDADSMKSPEEGFKPGDTLNFRPMYPAMLACATSEYVDLMFE